MSDLTSAMKQICEEKGLSYEAVLGTIESALAAAYRKDFGSKNQNIKIEFDPDGGKSKAFDVKTVVEDMPDEETADSADTKNDKKKEDTGGKKEESKDDKTIEKDLPSKIPSEAEEEERKFNPKTEMQISDAKLIKKTAKVGDEIKMKLEIPEAYGRMAAQTAKQVIIQRLREAERDMIYNEFKDKEHEVISGAVQRREGRVVLIDLGKAVGILPAEEQIFSEKYEPGARIKVFVREVNIAAKGPEIILSRTSDEILKKIFYLEIPEISNGLVELKTVSREAGSRSKVAVAAASDNIDPIGSCVGQRGARIQTIINELGGEKVDIIEYDENPEKFITHALSPAKVISIKIDEKERKALVKVAEDQLSLAIGKGGQNVRLAARLTGWKIDITGAGTADGAGEAADSADGAKKEKNNKKEEEKDDGEKSKDAEDKKQDKKSKKETKQKDKDKDDGKKAKKEKKESKKEKKKTSNDTDNTKDGKKERG